MISDILLPLIEQHFGGLQKQITDTPSKQGGSTLVTTFLAASQDFGDVSVYDDGDEVTVFLGGFTHFHIGWYEGHLSRNDEEVVAKRVVEFLAIVFADEIECWRRWGGGGCGPRGSGKGELFVWSGRVRPSENPGSSE